MQLNAKQIELVERVLRRKYEFIESTIRIIESEVPIANARDGKEKEEALKSWRSELKEYEKILDLIGEEKKEKE